MKTILTLLFLASVLVSFSQTETLNQLDKNGKKDGKWILYLDSKGTKLKDSTDALYMRYTYYDHGLNIYPMGNFITKNGKMELPISNIESKGKIKLLDGEYKCFDKKGRILFIHVFKNGEYVSYKEFSKSGELQTFFDYTKHCEGQSHSWYLYTYDKTGKIKTEMCVKKNENGKWPGMAG